jgi:DNA-binding CsgD family transcriptional regulator
MFVRSTPERTEHKVSHKSLVAFLLVLQVACAAFFVSDILLTVVGLRAEPVSWQTREFLEIGAALGLLLGGVLGAVALRRTKVQSDEAKARLEELSGAFSDLVAKRFGEWKLTGAERDVALFAIKGMTTREISDLRNTSEGTVKAQCNAIYRKAGVSNRYQLVSLFVEELIELPLDKR